MKVRLKSKTRDVSEYTKSEKRKHSLSRAPSLVNDWIDCNINVGRLKFEGFSY